MAKSWLLRDDFETLWLMPKPTTRVGGARTPFLIWAVDEGDHWHGYLETARWKGDREWKKADFDAVPPPPNADELSRKEPRPDPNAGPVLECKAARRCYLTYRVVERPLDHDPDFCSEHQPIWRTVCLHGVSSKVSCVSCQSHFGSDSQRQGLRRQRFVRTKY